MNPLFTPEELNESKIIDKLDCKCKHCGDIFSLTKHQIQVILNKKTNPTGDFCSKKCGIQYRFKNNKPTVVCLNCGVKFKKQLSQYKRTKNHFCSRSCSATYNNKHKKFGIRRSKLEIYLEEQLRILYPNLEIHYNQKDAINSELDIYIPSFQLAFELNGIFHYEPIFGKDKLDQIQNNDQRKFQACIENNISLCIIDVSSFSYFKKERAKKYLDIITNII